MSDPTPQKNQAPGTTSDSQVGRLDELSRKAQEAQRTVAASFAEDRQKLSAAVADAKDKAEQGAQRLQANGQRAKANAAGTWNQVQTSWQEHVGSVREKLEERKAERDVKRLQSAADDAEVRRRHHRLRDRGHRGGRVRHAGRGSGTGGGGRSGRRREVVGF